MTAQPKKAGKSYRSEAVHTSHDHAQHESRQKSPREKGRGTKEGDSGCEPRDREGGTNHKKRVGHNTCIRSKLSRAPNLNVCTYARQKHLRTHSIHFVLYSSAIFPWTPSPKCLLAKVGQLSLHWVSIDKTDVTAGSAEGFRSRIRDQGQHLY